ncbi:MAG TPA: hypothetical protein PLN31_13130 [Azoarcus taiwanensis]|nr:hypothetical protein [Azoarcus taiwanensis]
MSAVLVSVLAALALLALSHSGTAIASSNETVCAEWPVNLIGVRSEAEAALACDGAADAAQFLAPVGLYLPPTIRIDFVEALPPYIASSAAGCYETTTQRVVMLHLEQFLQHSTWFGVPTDIKLFRSAVAHEVAHVLVGCHLEERRLPLAAHEYLAYVTMFATMDVESRERVLAANPGTGFTRTEYINDLVYAIDPELFGVAAFRHWEQQPDKQDFLRRMLAGEVVSELTP